MLNDFGPGWTFGGPEFVGGSGHPEGAAEDLASPPSLGASDRRDRNCPGLMTRRLVGSGGSC